jgi:hypothetical protein
VLGIRTLLEAGAPRLATDAVDVHPGHG